MSSQGFTDACNNFAEQSKNDPHMLDSEFDRACDQTYAKMSQWISQLRKRTPKTPQNNNTNNSDNQNSTVNSQLSAEEYMDIIEYMKIINGKLLLSNVIMASVIIILVLFK